MSRIDLKELAARESEQVEWKENVADVADVVRTLVAFANDLANLGGGYVVCGAAEARDEHGFQKMLRAGLTAARLKEIEGKVLTACRDKVDPPLAPLVPLVVELPADAPERRILVFVIPASSTAHSYRIDSKDASTYYVRVSRDTVEARNGLLRELLVRKQVQEPWDRRMNPQATAADIDLLVLREYLQRMGLWDASRSVDDYLSPTHRLHAMVPPLCAREPLTGVLRPRNFALLMFGHEPTRFFDGAFALFSKYPGTDRSDPSAVRHELTGNVVAQAERLRELLAAEAHTVFAKDSGLPNVDRYPLKALQEAMINALVHRDYELRQPARITAFVDRVEIVSPGSLPSAVDREAFLAGRASAYWRNQCLAYFFNKLQLAQAEGQGIPTIQRSLREQGAPPAEFELGTLTVTCLLQKNPQATIYEIASVYDEFVDFNTGKLESLSKVRAQLAGTVSALAARADLSDDELRDTLDKARHAAEELNAVLASTIQQIERGVGFLAKNRATVNVPQPFDALVSRMDSLKLQLHALIVDEGDFIANR